LAKTKVIVFGDKEELQFVDKLNEIMHLQAVLIKPVDNKEIIKALLSE
jgi:hypothetical protein